MINGFTQRGRLRLLSLIGIVVVGAGLIYSFPNIGWYLVIVTGIAWVMLQVSYYNQLNTSIQDTVLVGMGFTLAEDRLILTDYTLSHNYHTKINRVYVSAVAAYPFTLIRFTLSKGRGRNKIVQQYIGCEFTTEQNHEAVQLFDRNNPFQPTFTKDRQLESTEFNRLFNVYSANPSAPFYFLDPDTMSDLIDIRNSSRSLINMESFQNRILVYVNATDITKLVQSDLSIFEVLNGEIDQDKRKLYQQSTEQFIAQMQGIFSALDYKLNKLLNK